GNGTGQFLGLALFVRPRAEPVYGIGSLSGLLSDHPICSIDERVPLSAPSHHSAPALVQRLLITPVLPPPRLRRLAQLYVGLYLYGLSGALLLRSELGATPWDVLHQGLSLQTGLSIGTWSIIVGALLMLLWIPLRQKAGLGTLSNVIVIGLSVDLSLWLLPTTDLMPLRLLLLALGVLVCAVATGCYIGVGLGPGPRDGLMTG